MRKGQWVVTFTLGGTDFKRRVSDEHLLDVLADRFGVVNHVVYEGPEVAESNALAHRMREQI